MRLSLATNAVVAALIGFAVTLPLIFQAGNRRERRPDGDVRHGLLFRGGH